MPLTRATARTLCAANAQVGLRVGDARLDVQIDQAMNRLVRFRNAFVRREEYDATPITFVAASDPLQLDAPDALKMMVLALWREENDQLAPAGELEQRAYRLVEQDIVQAFEAANKADYVTAAAGTPFTRNWYAARLGLDTAGGLATSTVKLKRYVSRASDWIYQKIYEFELIDRNRVHLSVPMLSEKMGFDTTPYSPAIDYEVMRLVCQALALEGIATPGDANAQQLAAGFYTEALAMIQRRLLARLEELRHDDYTAALNAATVNSRTWYASKLGLELAGGLMLSKVELVRAVKRAADWIWQKIYEYQLIERNRVHTSAPSAPAAQPASDTTALSPAIDYENLRLIVQAFLLEADTTTADQGPQQRAQQFFGEAIALIHRRLDAELEALRHGSYTATLATFASDTFGATTGQLGLELPLGLKYSMTELKRLANSAERRLVECGKWKNAIADFEVAITADGEVNMPAEVETVLGAMICDQPTLIKGRWYEVVEGGPGRVSEDSCNARGLLVDRGEFTVSGARVRRYYVGACSETDTLLVRAKRRFVPKTSDSTAMMIRNFSAIKAAATCLIHEGFCGPEQRDPGLAAFYWRQAMQILSDELAEFSGDSATPSMPVQTVGFGAGSIECLL